MDSNYHDLLSEFDLSFLVVTTSKLEGKSGFVTFKTREWSNRDLFMVIIFLQSFDYQPIRPKAVNSLPIDILFTF